MSRRGRGLLPGRGFIGVTTPTLSAHLAPRVEPHVHSPLHPPSPPTVRSLVQVSTLSWSWDSFVLSLPSNPQFPYSESVSGVIHRRQSKSLSHLQCFTDLQPIFRRRLGGNVVRTQNSEVTNERMGVTTPRVGNNPVVRPQTLPTPTPVIDVRTDRGKDVVVLKSG